jgi:hypothetical protein
MDYFDHAIALEREYPEFAGQFASSDSLKNVLAWMEPRVLSPDSVDIVGQDEFSYDFLIRLDANNRWLVFGVN